MIALTCVVVVVVVWCGAVCRYHVYSWLSKRNYDFAMPLDNALRDGESWYPGMVKRYAYHTLP